MSVSLNALLIYSLQQPSKGYLWMIKQMVKEVTCSGSQGQEPGLEPRPSFSNPPSVSVDTVNFHKLFTIQMLSCNGTFGKLFFLGRAKQLMGS